MLPNQKVKHSLSGECLTIKKAFLNVAICYIKKPYYLPKSNNLIDVQVFLIKNLIPL